jgi:hypothetical protein
MSGHTREPWPAPVNIPQTDGTGWWYINNIAAGMTEENARRIRACVHACAGIETERLENLGIGGLRRTAPDNPPCGCASHPSFVKDGHMCGCRYRTDPP